METIKPQQASGTARDTASADRRLSFDKIHSKYQARVYNLILRLVNDPEEAKDITQQTFINAYQGWNDVRGEAQVYTWL